MARLIGVEVPDQKRIGIALRYIYGIGPRTADEVCAKAKVDPGIRSKDLNDDQLSHLTTVLQGYKIEGDLRFVRAELVPPLELVGDAAQGRLEPGAWNRRRGCHGEPRTGERRGGRLHHVAAKQLFLGQQPR